MVVAHDLDRTAIIHGEAFGSLRVHRRLGAHPEPVKLGRQLDVGN